MGNCGKCLGNSGKLREISEGNYENLNDFTELQDFFDSLIIILDFGVRIVTVIGNYGEFREIL